MPVIKPTQSPACVWLVDGHEEFRNTYAEVLELGHGLRCDRQFGSAGELIEALTVSPGPAAVIMDQTLPGISGVAAVRSVKRLSPATVVLVYSAFKSHANAAEAMAGGASGYFPKYGPMNELVGALRVAIRQREQSVD